VGTVNWRNVAQDREEQLGWIVEPQEEEEEECKKVVEFNCCD
jgi:hypothetical protein